MVDLTLRMLRQMDVKLDRVISEVGELKIPIGRLETGRAQVHVTLAEHSLCMDKIDGRLDRIERRLELADA
jgi:hypothetical protein